jgi:predicted ribosomally synthesized peptide with nif11-like leader
LLPALCPAQQHISTRSLVAATGAEYRLGGSSLAASRCQPAQRPPRRMLPMLALLLCVAPVRTLLRQESGTGRVQPMPEGVRTPYPACCINHAPAWVDISLYYLIEDVYRMRSVFYFKPTGNIMSLDQARLFIERMKSDEEFAKRVMAIEDVAARLACIQSDGFDFSDAEIKEVSGNLSDEELDGAAGGFYPRCDWFSW